MSAARRDGCPARCASRLLLTPMRPVPVEFTGERGGEGPLTLGQLDLYNWLSETPGHFYAILYAELPVPDMVSVSDVAAAARVLIERHESLRTTYLPGEPPRQRVAAAGVQLLEVCSLGEGHWGPRDRAAAGEALVRWLRESPGQEQSPVRVAVAIAPGPGDRVIACAAAFSHLAVDHASIEILKADFAGLLGGLVAGLVGGLVAGSGRRRAGCPGHQPLDQAEFEATPAQQRKAAAALEYQREQSRRIPRCLYALPGARPSGESLEAELSSEAAALAVRRIAARTRTSRSSIVLAAICAVVARRTSYRELVFPLLSGNRFERHLMNYVGALVQDSIATVEIAGKSFDELTGHTWMRVVEASRHGRYDGARQAAMDELTEHERGLRFTYDPLFNSLVPESWSGLTAGVGFQPEDIDLALTRTGLRWRPMPASGTQIQFSLIQVDGCLRLDMWSGDAGLVPRAELESVLLAIERLLVAAAHTDIPDGAMPGLIGLEPLASADRILTDHCWVDVAAVQHLVDDAAAPAVTRVFASADGRPLIVYLTATDDIRTPRQAHAVCMAALPRHPTAITPRHYVICRTAPSDPADPAAWPPPLAAGTGRT